MGNRRFTQFADRQVGPDESRPSPSLGKKKQPKFEAESTADWPGPPGQGGPDFNRKVKAGKVKAYPKSSL